MPRNAEINAHPGLTQVPGQPQYLGGGNFAGHRPGRGGSPIPWSEASQWGNIGPRDIQTEGGNIARMPGSQGSWQQLQSPGRAAGQSVLRSLPTGPFWADKPQAGYAEGAGWQAGAGMPYGIGDMIRAIGAYQKNQYMRGQGVEAMPVGQPESMGSRIWGGLGSLLKFTPGGAVTSPLKMGYNVAEGLRGGSEFISQNFPQFGAAAGGSIFGRQPWMDVGRPPSPGMPASASYGGPTTDLWNQRGEGGGGGDGYSTQNWAAPEPRIPSSWYDSGERG